MQRVLVASFALVAACGLTARAEVTVLQNGVRPTPEYAGCKSTWISDEPYEKNRDSSRDLTLRCGGKRRILISFDLSPIPQGHVIHRAFLRLADMGYPHRQAGKFAEAFGGYRLTRDWLPSANWLEPAKSKDKEKGAETWAAPGGDSSSEGDFGQAETGLAASDRLADGPWGHMHELDVTQIVSRWQSGKLPNHGLLLKGKPCEVASSAWYVPAYRPALLVDHSPPDGKPSDLKPLTPAPEKLEFDLATEIPLVAPADVQRVGQNSDCSLRGASTDAYVKEAVERFPGSWGWMDMCRVGGRAGDFARALLYFDLREIPKGAYIHKARLHLSLTPYTNAHSTEYRYGAFLLRLPDAPGWTAGEATASERKAGVPWPAGGLLAASGAKPLSLGQVSTRREKDRTIPDAIEFDLTGAVRAWVKGEIPNCGIVLDNRIEGGAYDFYSSRSFDPKLRPYLYIEDGFFPHGQAQPIQAAVALPPGDYWVEPMREAHKRFTGKPGTLAMYGDSITVTMAYLANYSWAGKIQPKNCPPIVQKEMDLVAKYANLRLWHEWKGPEWGNTGMMRSDWLLANVDGWQKKMNPEAAVILFGTNDLGGLCPPEYTENMAAAIRRMLADGTVPMLTTVPPASGRMHLLPDYHAACLSIAHGLKVPVIDYYGEILRRRPDDWDGRLEKFGKPKDGYQVPTLISGDGTHPSNPKQYSGDFSEEALSSNGYNLRDYLTLRKYAEIISKVFLEEGKPR